MIRRATHAISSTSHTNPRVSFEKIMHNPCPNCGGTNLAFYYRSGSRRRVGALCYSCGMVGFFARNSFYELGTLRDFHSLAKS